MPNIYLTTAMQHHEAEAFREDVRAITQDSSDFDLFGPDATRAYSNWEAEETTTELENAKQVFKNDWSSDAAEGDEDAVEMLSNIEHGHWKNSGWTDRTPHFGRTQTWTLTSLEGELLGYLYVREMPLL